MKAVSVIIPVYNGEKTLGQCLHSVLHQTYKNYEVIVIDNNSTDSTSEIIKSFQQQSKKIRGLFEEKRGRGAARYKGEINARGEIILMTDADHILPENWIAKMMTPLLKKECDAVQGAHEVMAGNFWGKQLQSDVSRKFAEDAKKSSAIGRIDTGNFAISKDALQRIGFSSRKYVSGNDTELSIRFQKNNLVLTFLKDAKVQHNHVSSFREIACKYFLRAFWCSRITKDYRAYLGQTDFLRETNQTPWSFVKLFPGVIKALIGDGYKKASFDLVTGLAWRLGLVYGWMQRF